MLASHNERKLKNSLRDYENKPAPHIRQLTDLLAKQHSMDGTTMVPLLQLTFTCLTYAPIRQISGWGVI